MNAQGELPEGHVVAGKYRIETLLGAGGTGVVYRALGPGEMGRVALKLLHRHHISNDQVKRRFGREARLLKRLAGDNLVSLLDFGEDDEGRLYMALGYVEGEALDLYLTKNGPPPADVAVSIARDVCAALHVAHGQGILHRDLKPANVLLEPRPEGGPPRVRVCDFGLGKALRDPGVSTSALTDQHMIFGTPDYMSPEQVRGDEADARGDVYSTGVILYEMLTGQVPFKKMTPVQTMTAHLTEAPETPSQRAPHRAIAPALERVVMIALSKAPADRYQSAQELSDALAASLASPDDVVAVTPRAPSSATPGRDPVSVRPVSGVAVDPLASTLDQQRPSIIAGLAKTQRATLPTGVAPSLPTAPTSTPEPPPAEIPRSPWVWVAVVLLAASLGVALGISLASR